MAKRDDKATIAELRGLLIETAFRGERVIFGACHYFFCRMCGGSGSYVTPVDDKDSVKHREYCPIYKVLKTTESGGH